MQEVLHMWKDDTNRRTCNRSARQYPLHQVYQRHKQGKSRGVHEASVGVQP